MFLCLTLLAFLFGTADIPAHRPLFVIERNTNSNVVHYDARIGPDGELDPKEPVVVYWIMAAEDGRRQDLNLVERIRAYGFSVRRNGDGSYHMFLVSQRKRDIRVFRDGNAIHAETTIEGRRAYLSRIYVEARRGAWLRIAEYADVFGVDVTTGEKRYERILVP